MKPLVESASPPPLEARPPATSPAPDLPAEERIAAAAYFAEMLSTLAELGRGHGFGALGYMLDIARLEAESLARNRAPRPARPARQGAPGTAGPGPGAARRVAPGPGPGSGPR